MPKKSGKLARGYASPKKSKSLVFKLGLMASALVVLAVGAELAGLTNFYTRSAEQADNQSTSEPKDIYTPATEQEQKQVEQSKTNPENPKPQPTPLPDKKVVIASAEQSGGKLVVMTELYGVGWQECELLVSKGSEQIKKTTEVLYQAEFSTCMGFSVPVNELGSSGDWQVKLTGKKTDGSSQISELKTVSVIKY